MLEPDFTSYLTGAIKDYAQDKVAAGNWQAEAALEKSAASYNELLPNGLSTKDHYLFSIFDDHKKVGMIWFFADDSPGQNRAFIYDFVIDKAFRRQGLGKQALLALEEKVRALKIDVLALHVFGHNTAARTLYEQVGYEITNINMAKKLS